MFAGRNHSFCIKTNVLCFFAFLHFFPFITEKDGKIRFSGEKIMHEERPFAGQNTQQINYKMQSKSIS